MSSAACATPRSASPSATRGSGRSSARFSCAASRRHRRGPFAAQQAEARARVAERAGHPDVVARFRRVAAQRGVRRHVAEHGDADVERAARRVAADQLAAEAFGEREQAVAERGEPAFVGARQGERERERVRRGAHRGEVRQIDGERLVAERVRIDVGEEVAAFDQHVRRYRELLAGRRDDQRAIVADAERRARDFRRLVRKRRRRCTGTTGEKTLDQGKLGKHREPGRQIRNGGMDIGARNRACFRPDETRSAGPSTALARRTPCGPGAFGLFKSRQLHPNCADCNPNRCLIGATMRSNFYSNLACRPAS